MKVLHLAAGNRWTGAAAPAFAEVAALRQAGVDAHYAYVGGYKLQAKIGRLGFTHPIIAKAQNPFSFVHTANAIERLLDHHGFDVVHAHLTYDHWLARFAVRDPRTRIARTFHSRRVIRSDPFTKSLLARTDLICVINDTLADADGIRDRAPLFTPPPLDTEEFFSDGPDVRSKYAISPDTLLVAAIGKLSKGRGFDLVLRTFAAIQKQMPARLMIIGHGPYRPALEAMAREQALDVIWAGYHEEDLADHYRAADFLLFTSKGSDEGHRAVLEAMGCGCVPIATDIPGLRALLGDLPLIAAEEQLAACLLSRLESLEDLRQGVTERAGAFGYRQAAKRLMTVYSSIL